MVIDNPYTNNNATHNRNLAMMGHEHNQARWEIQYTHCARAEGMCDSTHVTVADVVCTLSPSMGVALSDGVYACICTCGGVGVCVCVCACI